MADVFLSYARVDLAKAERVKAALEAAGLSVFFDVEGLDGGDVFPDVLDREVKTAGAVVSLWSPHSLSRPWVKQECSIGLKRKCLVPLAIEPLGQLDVPVAFEGLQVIDFTGFHARADTPEWRQLMRALARTLKRPELLGEAQVAAEKPKPVKAAAKGGGINPLLVAFGALALVVGGGIAAVQLMSVNEVAKLEAPEEVEAGVAAEAEPEPEPVKTAFVPPGAGVTPVQPGVSCGDVEALVYFNFDRTDLTPEALSVLEEAMTAGFDCVLVEVRIEAHDDLISSPSYAEGVSQRRAEAVAGWLTANGVEVERITRIGFGSSQPWQPGERSPANRRAVVMFDYEAPGWLE
ncbi:TIR domain-containing protein [Hyphomonas sp.]|uniref:TIR domain-containing protein n=1 Tax=Hyphomonas sp. TaxID=87 RepID=UPI003918C8B7